MLACLLIPPAVHSQSPPRLPNAPLPAAVSASSLLHQYAGPSGSGVTPTASRAAWQRRRWGRYINPGERVPPLYPHDKWLFWLHEQARPWTFVPVFLSGGYGQLADSPHYGSDSGAFGERLGAAYIRDATMRFFCDSFVPVLSREDPRYHRKAYGKYLHRAGWAAERSFVIQRDNGRPGFNYSDILGHLAASALTPLYYPGPSANAGVVFETWATSIAGDAGNKILIEFLPDALNAWRRHRHAHHRGSSQTR